VLTGARAAVERLCDGEEDQQWLELGARVKEGMRELKSKGERAVRAGGARGFI
jgi:hypothetical protein